ncbi:MAG TPA: phosphoenolpyruvate synthase, partial [Planctomycetaceae bacterium]|nr:phosphoenolpyruvate synthase [Planctomycetaceae bacterium]
MSDAVKGTSEYIRWFNEISIDDIASVGGKNASLGEMYQSLTDQGILVPNGFAVTAQAYHDFLSVTGVDQKIRSILADLDTSDMENLQQRGHAVRKAILSVTMPDNLQQQIITAYETLCGETVDIDVAVRSSATAEDLPDASFAGQQETMLNVRGPGVLLETCRRCFASLFTDRAISYRQERDFDHFTIGLSIGVQLMVRSDLAYSGVMFSIDTETGFPDAVLINAAYGLGENVVQGSVNPDEFYIFKTTLLSDPECRPILQRRLGTKEFKLIYDLGGTRMTKNVPVSLEDRRRFCIPDEDLLLLARWACVIEDHYSQKKGQLCPMDMEWAKDGLTGKMYIVQARPETVQSQKIKNVLETFELKNRSQVLVTGRAVGERIAHGPVRIIDSPIGLKQFQPGEILVTDKTDPDWEPTMKKAAAIVTNRGG